MPSQRQRKGYYLVDHRASPGLPEIPEGTIFEADVLTCSHCQTSMLKNPARTRERAYCPGCDHYICDGCEAVRQKTMQCADIRRVFDRLQHEAVQLIGKGE